jgi:hypothetical protein
MCLFHRQCQMYIETKTVMVHSTLWRTFPNKNAFKVRLNLFLLTSFLNCMIQEELLGHNSMVQKMHINVRIFRSLSFLHMSVEAENDGKESDAAEYNIQIHLYLHSVCFFTVLRVC